MNTNTAAPSSTVRVPLPSTGVTLDWERMLSAPFIVGDRYGTRCSTVLVVARDGQARFVERSFDAAGRLSGVVDERFGITPETRFEPRS